jgi:hypothetical protein
MSAFGTFFPYKFERRTAGFAVFKPELIRKKCQIAAVAIFLRLLAKKRLVYGVRFKAIVSTVYVTHISTHLSGSKINYH